jgi:MFS family permease
MDSKRSFLSLVSYNHALTHGVVLSIPIAANFIQEKSDLAYTEVFIPYALFILMYGCGALLAGYLIDKKGVLKPIFWGISATTVSMLALAVSDNLLWFTIWIIVAGFGLSFAHPSGLTLVSNIYVKKRGKAMGTFGFIGQFGQVLPPLAIGFIGTYYSWNYFFMLFFVLYLVALLFSARLLRLDTGIGEPVMLKKDEYKKALAGMLTGLVALVIILTTLRGINYRGVTSIVTFYSKDVLGLNILIGAFFLSLMLALGFPAHLIGGWLADKKGPVKPLIIFSFSSIFGIALCLVVNLYTFVLGLCIIGFSFFCAQPAENVLIANVSSLNIRGMLYGVKFLVSFGVSFIAPVIFGPLADAYGLAIVFYIILIFGIAIMVNVILISMLYKGTKKPGKAMNEE